jgi:hypothetical protein
MHLEIIGARYYYGRHATGSVLLNNGNVVLHMTRKDCKDVAFRLAKREIDRLTEVNNHTEAAIIATSLLGTEDEVEILKSIQARHDRYGHLKYEDMKTRDSIASPYFRELDRTGLSSL